MKAECVNCGQQVPTTGHPLLFCGKGQPKPTVERVPLHPELAAPVSRLTEADSTPIGSLTDATGSLTTPDGSLTVPDVTPTGSLTGSLTVASGSLTKQQRYRQTHPGWYRTYQREYMRRRRAHEA